MSISRWTALGFVLVPLAALYGAAWLTIAGEAGRRMDAWQESEAALGRRWTCPDRTIAGFPFAITVDCTDASFAAQGRDRGDDIARVAHVSAAVSILRPSRLALSLRPPFSYATSDGATSVSARWTMFDLAFGPLPDPRMIDLHGADVSFGGTFGPVGRQSGRMAKLAAHFTMREGPGEPTLAFAIAVGATDLAPLDEVFGDAKPVKIDLAGHLNRAGLGAASTPEAIIDAWRLAGGHVDLTASRLSRGTVVMSANGVVGLDDAHRPQGHLQAEFVGVGPVLRRYGIEPGLVAAGSLLSTLLGGGQRRPATQSGAISLPIDLHGGRLGIGPIMTPVALPALY